MDIALIPNPSKPDAAEAARELLKLLSSRLARDAQGRGGGKGGQVKVMSCPTRADLLQFNPSLVVVLGGDGTILSTAQAMDGLEVPVLGVNFGKLGYLAAYSLEEFLENLDLILAGKAPHTERLMLHGALYPWNNEDSSAIQSLAELEALTPRASGIALNDIVINAGAPFRMIELEVQINQQRTTSFRSDGLIVATASGSTGYNLSAGGPLISPEVAAMVLTPICPHTLSFRPVVLPASSSILVCPHHLNAGSRVNFDGQVNVPIGEDECLLIRRATTRFMLVENPQISHWQMLAQKMHWAESPRL